MSDRSLAVEASIADVKFTLILTIALVVMVILIFLRHFWATVIPSIAVPLALVATFAVMYPLGYSVNNLTLMAMTIAVGFVVDDAIVMIENIVRYIEKGDTPLEAALKGSGEIGFTIVSITISLVAVFIPLLLMGGMVGVLFREFAVTVTAAVVMSAFVSLTLTPVMCARFLHRETGERKRGRIDQACENAFNAVQRGYDRGLVWVLDHQPLTLAATVALAVLTGWLYVTIPKGLFPQQDTGFVFITVEGRQDISFAAMVDRQAEVTNALLQDPAVESVVAFAGTGSIVPSENLVRMFVQLKPRSRRSVSADQFIQRVRPELAKIQDVNTYLQVSQDLTFGGRLSRTQYQYTLTSLDTGGAQSLGADPGRAHARALQAAGQCERPADRRPPSRRRGRPRHGLSARRLAGRHRPDPLRHVRRAPGGDDLRRDHAIQGAAGIRRRSSSADRRRCRASMCRAPPACRCRSAPWRASPTRSRRSPSTTRASFRR